jgi:tetratricopeptide (TPR) repeat protein
MRTVTFRTVLELLVGATFLVVPTTIRAGCLFDYRNPPPADLGRVETHHFNDDVRNLKKGQSSEYIMDDLAFVLNHFSNHYLALDSMARLWRQYLKAGKKPPAGPVASGKDPDFWFKQAMRCVPHDGMVPFLYGIHLHKLGKLDAAVELYKKAEQLLPNPVEVHYNLGLLYFDKGNYEAAKLYAQKAYKLGYPLPGLKNKLISRGVWRASDAPKSP